MLCPKLLEHFTVSKTKLTQLSGAELCKLCHCEMDNYVYLHCRYMMIATFYYQLYGPEVLRYLCVSPALIHVVISQ